MIWLAVGTAALAVLGVLLWGARKGGKDAVRADNAEDSLAEIRKATAPVSDDDLKRVRDKYRRD